MTDYVYYILWFHKVFGTTAKGRNVLKYYGGDYEALYKAVAENRENSGYTQESERGKLLYNSVVDSDIEVARCTERGWHIVSCISEYYPKELLKINDHPHILFCDGDIEVLKGDVKFAVVGSREADEDAEVVARNSAYNLAKTGAVIVSGAALGIDSAAHLGAIEAGGTTIGVLGCGLGCSYMNRIGDFYSRVKKNGVYVTEMLPYADYTKYTFSERNRLISGMSNAVLVASAAEKSGALGTAKYAKKQGRRVYAMAPEIFPSGGCKKLIEEGSYLFYNAGDMAYPVKELYAEDTFNEEYCNMPVSVLLSKVKREDMNVPQQKSTSRKKNTANNTAKTTEEKTEKKSEEKIQQPEEQTVLPDYLSQDAVEVYKHICNKEKSLDELVGITGLPINRVLISVSELESEMLVKVCPGNRVVKV